MLTHNNEHKLVSETSYNNGNLVKYVASVELGGTTACGISMRTPFLSRYVPKQSKDVGEIRNVLGIKSNNDHQ